jgi:hypothetical protein
VIGEGFVHARQKAKPAERQLVHHDALLRVRYLLGQREAFHGAQLIEVGRRHCCASCGGWPQSVNPAASWLVPSKAARIRMRASSARKVPSQIERNPARARSRSGGILHSLIGLLVRQQMLSAAFEAAADMHRQPQEQLGDIQKPKPLARSPDGLGCRQAVQRPLSVVLLFHVGAIMSFDIRQNPPAGALFRPQPRTGTLHCRYEPNAWARLPGTRIAKTPRRYGQEVFAMTLPQARWFRSC